MVASDGSLTALLLHLAGVLQLFPNIFLSGRRETCGQPLDNQPGPAVFWVPTLLGLSLRLWYRLHGTFGVTAVLLAVVHASIMLSTKSGVVKGEAGLYSILVGQIYYHACLRTDSQSRPAPYC